MIPFTLPRLPQWAWTALGAVLLILAFYLLLDSYGDSRFDAGRAAEKAAWEKAEAELLKKSGEAATAADRKAAAREAEHAAEVAEEREKIDRAVEEGSSPLDVLFGGPEQ